MSPVRVIKRFGVQRGMQMIGFIAVWRAIGMPTVEELNASIRGQFDEAGVSKSAAYRYLGYLREWAVELGRDPNRLEGLMLEIARGFEVDEGELAQVGERVIG